MMLKYLIIIPTFNRCQVLCDTIKSMEFLKENPEVKLLVVDDGSTDGTLQTLQKKFPFVEFSKNAVQRGPAYSRNFGASKYKAEYYIFLDSDVEVPEKWWQAITSNLSQNAVLAGKVVNFYTKEVELGPRYVSFIGGSIPCSPDRANVGSSCNLVVPASCFRAISGFDEEIPYYFEDSDLCIRARKAGFPVRYIEDAVVYHKNSGYKTGKRIQMHVQNRTYAMSKSYENQPVKLAIFFIFNTGWVFSQSALRSLKFQFNDSMAILKGWVHGNRKYMKRRLAQMQPKLPTL